MSGPYSVWRQKTRRRGVSQLPPSLLSGPHKGQGPDTWAAVKRRRCKRTGRRLICIDSARPPIRTSGVVARAPFGGGLTAPRPYGRRVLRPAGAGRRRALPGALAGLRALPVSGGGVRRAAERASERACGRSGGLLGGLSGARGGETRSEGRSGGGGGGDRYGRHWPRGWCARACGGPGSRPRARGPASAAPSAASLGWRGPGVREAWAPRGWRSGRRPSPASPSARRRLSRPRAAFVSRAAHRSGEPLVAPPRRPPDAEETWPSGALRASRITERLAASAGPRDGRAGRAPPSPAAPEPARTGQAGDPRASEVRRRKGQLKVAVRASEVAERVQALAAKRDTTWVRSPELTWWVRRTDSRELSSDLHVYTTQTHTADSDAHAHLSPPPPPLNNTKEIKVILGVFIPFGPAIITTPVPAIVHDSKRSILCVLGG